ncbi:DUF72 domain-containing protein [Flavobacterium rhizosphaerae]|uniref:DUF72 domain-containing protein n=1 Tax=Flavobacterium rhizosphaerae TaxID=3163298 RepID=A0ABW8YWZ5_9FLAO
MKETNLHTGCSSYATQSWQPVFYPEGLPKKQWFEYYCKYFDTYELNATFYRFPTVKSLQSWYHKTPQAFTFSIKVPKTITHIKRLVDCNEEIEKFYATAREGLKDKLGCVLFQLPPSFSYTPERLDAVIMATNPDFNNVVEFRNESWWNEGVIKRLADNNITFCSVNYPKLPTTVIKTTQTGYVRMHGNPKLFYAEYTQQQIETLYEDIMSQNFKQTYLYFNNTASSAAIINALQVKNMNAK